MLLGLYVGQPFAKFYMNLTIFTMTRSLLRSHPLALNSCIGLALINLVLFVTLSITSSLLYPFSLLPIKRFLAPTQILNWLGQCNNFILLCAQFGSLKFYNKYIIIKRIQLVVNPLVKNIKFVPKRLIISLYPIYTS